MKIGAITLGIVVVFIIILASSFVYKAVVENDKTIEWPPHITKCPEYWNEDPADSTKCVNYTNINKNSSDQVDAYDGTNKDILRTSSAFYNWDGIN